MGPVATTTVTRRRRNMGWVQHELDDFAVTSNGAWAKEQQPSAATAGTVTVVGSAGGHRV
jgi:hypothetical protein